MGSRGLFSRSLQKTGSRPTPNCNGSGTRWATGTNHTPPLVWQVVSHRPAPPAPERTWQKAPHDRGLVGYWADSARGMGVAAARANTHQRGYGLDGGAPAPPSLEPRPGHRLRGAGTGG